MSDDAKRWTFVGLNGNLESCSSASSTSSESGEALNAEDGKTEGIDDVQNVGNFRHEENPESSEEFASEPRIRLMLHLPSEQNDLSDSSDSDFVRLDESATDVSEDAVYDPAALPTFDTMSVSCKCVLQEPAVLATIDDAPISHLSSESSLHQKRERVLKASVIGLFILLTVLCLYVSYMRTTDKRFYEARIAKLQATLRQNRWVKVKQQADIARIKQKAASSTDIFNSNHDKYNTDVFDFLTKVLSTKKLMPLHFIKDQTVAMHLYAQELLTTYDLQSIHDPFRRFPDSNMTELSDKTAEITTALEEHMKNTIVDTNKLSTKLNWTSLIQSQVSSLQQNVQSFSQITRHLSAISIYLNNYNEFTNSQSNRISRMQSELHHLKSRQKREDTLMSNKGNVDNFDVPVMNNEATETKDKLISQLKEKLNNAENWTQIWKSRYLSEYNVRKETERNSTKSLNSCLTLLNTTLYGLLPKLNMTEFYNYVNSIKPLVNFSNYEDVSQFVEDKWSRVRSFAENAKPVVYEYFENLWSFATLVTSDYADRKDGKPGTFQSSKANDKNEYKDTTTEDSVRFEKKSEKAYDSSRKDACDKDFCNFDENRESSRRENRNSDRHGLKLKKFIKDSQIILKGAKEKLKNTVKNTRSFWRQNKHKLFDLKNTFMDATSSFFTQFYRKNDIDEDGNELLRKNLYQMMKIIGEKGPSNGQVKTVCGFIRDGDVAHLSESLSNGWFVCQIYWWKWRCSEQGHIPTECQRKLFAWQIIKTENYRQNWNNDHNKNKYNNDNYKFNQAVDDNVDFFNKIHDFVDDRNRREDSEIQGKHQIDASWYFRNIKEEDKQDGSWYFKDKSGSNPSLDSSWYFREKSKTYNIDDDRKKDDYVRSRDQCKRTNKAEKDLHDYMHGKNKMPDTGTGQKDGSWYFKDYTLPRDSLTEPSFYSSDFFGKGQRFENKEDNTLKCEVETCFDEDKEYYP